MADQPLCAREHKEHLHKSVRWPVGMVRGEGESWVFDGRFRVWSFYAVHLDT